MLNNYLGITGFTSSDQIAQLIDYVGIDYDLMAGVLVSDKTFHGISNKYPVRYPPVSQIPAIWHPAAFNVLHYCTADPALPEVGAVLEQCHVGLGMGVQLNVAWPNIQALEHIRARGVHIIMQVNDAALRETGGIPSKFVKLVSHYYGLVDHILFDMSMGRGVPLDAEMFLRYITPLQEQFPAIPLVAAGGLGPDNLHNLLPLIAFKDKLSIDAESKLRDDRDVLQLDWCVRYLNAAIRVLGRRVSTAGHLKVG